MSLELRPRRSPKTDSFLKATFFPLCSYSLVWYLCEALLNGYGNVIDG